MTIFFFLIGPAGSGKSTIGKKVKKKLKYRLFEADNFHSQKNINKMKKGIKLKYKDRLPWLIRINKNLKKYNNSGGKFIIACSALKKSYRNTLSKDLCRVSFFYLKCKEIELIRRNYYRKHFFSLSLIRDQIFNFESSRDLININADKNIKDVANIVIKKIRILCKTTQGVLLHEGK